MSQLREEDRVRPQSQGSWLCSYKATLTAAVMSTSGGMGKDMDKLVRQVATKLSVKRGERYSGTVGFVRRRIRFDLLRTCVIALRGYKKTTAPDSIRDLDFNLRPVAY